jgi:hypothetical protein
MTLARSINAGSLEHLISSLSESGSGIPAERCLQEETGNLLEGSRCDEVKILEFGRLMGFRAALRTVFAPGPRALRKPLSFASDNRSKSTRSRRTSQIGGRRLRRRD